MKKKICCGLQCDVWIITHNIFMEITIILSYAFEYLKKLSSARTLSFVTCGQLLDKCLDICRLYIVVSSSTSAWTSGCFRTLELK